MTAPGGAYHPFSGSSPEPRKVIAPNYEENDWQFHPSTGEVIDLREPEPVADPTPPTPEAPPTPAPDYDAKIRELEEKYQQQMKAMELRLEFRQTPPQWTPQGIGQMPAIQLPDGIDPDERPTFQQLAAILGNVTSFNAQYAAEVTAASRAAAALGITPEVEQSLLQQFPEIGTYQEPNRTRALIRAYQTLPHPASLTTTAPVAPVATSVKSTAPLPRMAPLTESAQPVATEPGSFNRLATLRQQLAEIESDRKLDRQTREQKRRETIDQILKASGAGGLNAAMSERWSG